MRASKEIVTAVGTLALAVGIGFVMQSTDEAKDRYGVRTAPVPKDAARVAEASVIPGINRVQLVSANDNQPIRTQRQQSRHAVPASCSVETAAQVMPDALVQITLNAPCQQNERLIVHHNGLMFTDRTDERGGMTVTIPALATNAVFIIAFEKGKGAVVQADVPALMDMRRAAFQWSGPGGFELHALEFGADYDTPGHVWSGVQAADVAERGFVTRLGNASVEEPLLAEIYTYPAKTGPIDLRVEAEIHARNCGLDFEVQSIQYDFGSLRSEDVVLSIPDCSVMGDLLVLSNLITDQVIASR